MEAVTTIVASRRHDEDISIAAHLDCNYLTKTKSNKNLLSVEVDIMSLKKTYIDSGVLITAFQGIESVSIRANEILNDDNREFASSRFVKLEVLPKATFNQQQDETEFYEMV